MARATLSNLSRVLFCAIVTHSYLLADATFAQDLIVDGNACIGEACLDPGETFDTETLKIKDVLPWVLFDDTSTGDFPANDWRLTVNEGVAGGISKFSLSDITSGRAPVTIEAGASSNSLYIDAGGRVGFRTSTPAASLHAVSGNSPSLRLEQTGSSGLGPYRWDVGGNDVNFFIRDSGGTARLPFRIQPGAPDNSIYIGTNAVGFGTATPIGNGTSLHIFGAATADVFSGIGPNPSATGPALNFGYSGASLGRSSGFFNIRPDVSAVAPNPSLRFLTQNLQRMIIDRDGNVGIGQFGAIVGSNPGTSPLAKLHVQGAVRADGGFFSTDTSIDPPDYVFEPDYQLMPLKELAAYVEKEKHLPEIPSARQIKEQGIDLGAMQMRLLRKVEELTLYTIKQEEQARERALKQEEQVRALHERNRALAMDNARLQERVAALEAVVHPRAQH